LVEGASASTKPPPIVKARPPAGFHVFEAWPQQPTYYQFSWLRITPSDRLIG